jgi:hypothetical protein
MDSRLFRNQFLTITLPIQEMQGRQPKSEVPAEIRECQSFRCYLDKSLGTT